MTTVGTSLADGLNGTASDDCIFGRGGNDLINGGRGSDRLHGEAGDDVIYGDGGADRFWGGAGNDWVIADWRDARVRAGLGADVIEFDDRTLGCRQDEPLRVARFDPQGEGDRLLFHTGREACIGLAFEEVQHFGDRHVAIVASALLRGPDGGLVRAVCDGDTDVVLEGHGTDWRADMKQAFVDEFVLPG